MPEKSPIKLSLQAPEGNRPLFDTEILKEFLGEDWQHVPVEDLEDFFILTNPENGNSLKLMFARSNANSEAIFRAFTRGSERLLWGGSGVFMRGITSLDLLPNGIGYVNEKALRVTSKESEFLLYLDSLQGLFKAGEENTCYFDYADIRKPSVHPLGIEPVAI